jgi:hypothetical protein
MVTSKILVFPGSCRIRFGDASGAEADRRLQARRAMGAVRGRDEAIDFGEELVEIHGGRPRDDGAEEAIPRGKILVEGAGGDPRPREQRLQAPVLGPLKIFFGGVQDGVDERLGPRLPRLPPEEPAKEVGHCRFL